MHTLLIRNGHVIDGTGSSGYKADIAIDEDNIVDIKPQIDETAKKTINAEGLVVSPGFIDIHSHVDASIFSHPLSNSKLLQGVTSEVSGNCGIGIFPVNPVLKEKLAAYLETHNFDLPSEGITWTDLKEYAGYLSKLDLGVNIIPLVPHGILRSAVMDFDDRTPSAQELDEMKRLLETALNQGAWGLSTGLIYPPGSFANTEELIALAEVLSKFDAVYSSHIRSESGQLLEAIEEAIEIGRKSGARVQISHLKAMGQPQWGLGGKLLDLLERARKEGVDVSADQYPYEASSTALTALLPQWAHSGGIDKLLERLEDPELLPRIKDEIQEEMNVRGGPDCVLISTTVTEKNSNCNGKTVETIAKEWNLNPVDTVVKLLLEEKGAINAVYFSMDKKDLATILADKNVSVGSDGWGLCAKTDGAKAVHPRSYGTFPRILGHYVREEKLLSLETAIYKMTGLAANRLRLKDRGLIRKGYKADITIFNPDTIKDKSEFTDPHRYPEGIEHVIINGKIAAEQGKLTGIGAGKVLLKNH